MNREEIEEEVSKIYGWMNPAQWKSYQDLEHKSRLVWGDEIIDALMRGWEPPSIINGNCMQCGVPVSLPTGHIDWHRDCDVLMQLDAWFAMKQQEEFAKLAREVSDLVSQLLPKITDVVDTNFAQMVEWLNTGEEAEVLLLSLGAVSTLITKKAQEVALRAPQPVVTPPHLHGTITVQEHGVIASGHLPLTREMLQKEMLTSIEKIWGEHPDMPFAQILLHATNIKTPGELMFLEDTDLTDALRRML